MRILLSCLAASLTAGHLCADGPNVAPTLALSHTNLAYVAGAGPLLLDEGALVSDPDSPNFDGGTLTVAFVPEGQPEERLGIRNQGAGPGNIFTSGHTVSYAIQPIGTFAGGTNGTSPLVVTLNGKATAEAMQALVRGLTYNTDANPPLPGPRRVRLVLTDGDGGTSLPVYLEVRVGPSNHPPVAIATFSPRIILSVLGTNGIRLARNNSNAVVAFDGSMSSDADHDPLSYAWFTNIDSQPFALGVRATNQLTVGMHTIRLRVSDSHAESEAALVVEVVTLGEAIEGIVRRLLHSALPRQRRQPLVTMLKTTGAALERGQFTAAASHLEAFQNKIRAQVEPAEPTLAHELTQDAQLILETLRQP